MTARATGDIWEGAALAWLLKSGLRLVARNFHCRHGEIDLVLLDRSGHEGDTLVFVEVRYRDDATRGSGTASVGTAKQRKLVRTAQIFLQAHAQFAALACRFDVIGCTGTPQRPVFEWTRNAFDAI
ncbi:MAG: YraN family protein [Proteobacteria bacterium]|uniref:YraN family protein n=1 Tax=Rudaea sp. TaxID=2136325 RepID=UPI003782D4B1|nr:YraN family protein [Pseudomonadota bacterium]